MAQPPPRSWGAIGSDHDERETWQGYRQALELMSSQPNAIELLMEHLSTINAQLEAQARETVARTAAGSSPSLASYLASLDSLIPSSTPMATPESSMGRGPVPSPFPRLSPLDLLEQRRGVGPTLAAKLAVASYRAHTRSEGAE